MKKNYKEPLLIQHVYADICTAASTSIPDGWGDVNPDEDPYN